MSGASAGWCGKTVPEWHMRDVRRLWNERQEEISMRISERAAYGGIGLGAATVVLLCCIPLAANRGGDNSSASRPPMGWDSWDSYGTAVREVQVKANADAMARELVRYGWQYIVVDIQWYEPSAGGHDYRAGAALTMDEYGRLLPATNRFPSASGGAGFKNLAAYVHGKGLKFGIHIMRGIPRQAAEQNLPILGTNNRAAEIADRTDVCEWNHDMYGVDMSKPGAQAYYDSIVALYVSWGVDFIKADDMSRPYALRAPEVHALSGAIRKSGASVILSLSPGPAPIAEASDLRENARMWRISDDFWDDWKLLKKQFDYTRDWAPYIGIDETWPDADMLPLGRLRITDKNGAPQQTRFTPDEQQTVMTLWAIFRSALIFGGDLPSADPATLALLTNREVLEIDQNSSGNRQVLERSNLRVWLADVPEGQGKYAAVFNLGDVVETIHLNWTELGIQIANPAVRNLWLHKNLGHQKNLDVTLRPHASVLYRVSP
jgi:alpha-galactosidase